MIVILTTARAYPTVIRPDQTSIGERWVTLTVRGLGPGVFQNP